MALTPKINIRGLEEYVKKIQDAGKDVDNVVESALDKVADFLQEEMASGVAPHKDKGRALKSVKRREVERSGTRSTVDVGALDIRGEDQDGFHIVYQEYGSPGKLKADPWLAPALEKKAKIRKIITDELKNGGVPVE